MYHLVIGYLCNIKLAQSSVFDPVKMVLLNLDSYQSFWQPYRANFRNDGKEVSNTMFPNFLIPNLRQLRMRDVIHINDRNTAASRTRFVQLS
jgi:hypothetical protein